MRLVIKEMYKNIVKRFLDILRTTLERCAGKRNDQRECSSYGLSRGVITTDDYENELEKGKNGEGRETGKRTRRERRSTVDSLLIFNKVPARSRERRNEMKRDGAETGGRRRREPAFSLRKTKTPSGR